MITSIASIEHQISSLWIAVVAELDAHRGWHHTCCCQSTRKIKAVIATYSGHCKTGESWISTSDRSTWRSIPEINIGGRIASRIVIANVGGSHRARNQHFSESNRLRRIIEGDFVIAITTSHQVIRCRIGLSPGGAVTTNFKPWIGNAREGLGRLPQTGSGIFGHCRAVERIRRSTEISCRPPLCKSYLRSKQGKQQTTPCDAFTDTEC